MIDELKNSNLSVSHYKLEDFANYQIVNKLIPYFSCILNRFAQYCPTFFVFIIIYSFIIYYSVKYIVFLIFIPKIVHQYIDILGIKLYTIYK